MSFSFFSAAQRRPRAHSSWAQRLLRPVWLSLPHFVYNSVRSSTQLPLACWTQLNYIIVRCPLDLWNRMFNRHQAEITVMQFRGHSLPVHHTVVYHGITLSHFISQFPPTRFPLLTAIWMCHFLPVHHLGIAFFGGRVKGQNNTLYCQVFLYDSFYTKQIFLEYEDHGNQMTARLLNYLHISKVMYIYFVI